VEIGCAPASSYKCPNILHGAEMASALGAEVPVTENASFISKQRHGVKCMHGESDIFFVL
jgi:hypothetical protein